VTAGPTQVAIGEIALSDFFARIILSEKGRLNLRDIVRTDPAATPAPAASATPTAPASAPTGATGAAAQAALPVKIGRISVASGHINFSDLFVRPNFRLNLTGMTGAVSALTSDPRTAADLELRGQLDGSAPVEIIGRINPLASPLFVDIKGTVRGAELSTLSAYSTTYTGYGIERGRLTLNLAYKVEGRKIDAQHRIFLDQLTFGTERIEGPSVVKLPILFAVRLLQNRRGEIDLNLPITGTLDDPQFRIGPIIWQILGNLITRAVTAPFSLLASLGGGSTEELSVVEFEPGSVVLSEAARKRLSTLGKALADRPSLRLELTGRVDAERDREGYRRAQLAAAVQAQRVRDLVRKGESTVGIGTVPGGEVPQATQRDRDAARSAGTRDGDADADEHTGHAGRPARTGNGARPGRRELPGEGSSALARARVPGPGQDALGRRRRRKGASARRTRRPGDPLGGRRQHGREDPGLEADGRTGAVLPARGRCLHRARLGERGWRRREGAGHAHPAAPEDHAVVRRSGQAA
jgi:hypothetical protein